MTETPGDRTAGSRPLTPPALGRGDPAPGFGPQDTLRPRPSRPSPLPPMAPPRPAPVAPPAAWPPAAGYSPPARAELVAPSTGRELAGRLVAAVIDQVILIVVWGAILFVTGVVLVTWHPFMSWSLAHGLHATAALLYFGLGEGLRGSTLGKYACGLKVVDVLSGEPVGVPRALLRRATLIVTSVPFGLGAASVLVDRAGFGRGWHDLAARSRVIRH